MRPRDRAANQAARQFGAITRDQALACGMSPGQVKRELRSGRWSTFAPGTYVIAGTPQSWKQKVAASVIAVGPTGAASHLSAGSLLGLIDGEPRVIDVTTRHGAHDGEGRGYVVHRARTFTDRDVRVVDGIRVTCAARTLVDLAAVLRRRRLEAALDTALLRGLVSVAAVRRYIDTHRLGCLRGVGTLLRLLDDRGSGVPESELERELLALVSEYDLPVPVRQASAGRYRVDFAYPADGVLIELDGRATHGSAAAFIADRTRDNALVTQGWRALLHFTWHHLTEERSSVAETITAVLRRAG